MNGWRSGGPAAAAAAAAISGPAPDVGGGREVTCRDGRVVTAERRHRHVTCVRAAPSELQPAVT